MFLRQTASAPQPAPAPKDEAPPVLQRRNSGATADGPRPVEAAPATAEAPSPAPVPPPAAVAGNGRAASAEDFNGKRLIVGDGIRLKGEITACDRLVVEGHVEATLNETRALEIRPSGRFLGSCEVEEAEVSGTYEGDLTVRGQLTVRASGRITGKICYGEIELERGGRIAGELSVRESGGSSPASTNGATGRNADKT